MNEEWQKAHHSQDNIIPAINCFVAKVQDQLQAYLKISAWVREQGVTVGDRNIEVISLNLLELWRKIPEDYNQVELKRDDFCSVLYRYCP